MSFENSSYFDNGVEAPPRSIYLRGAAEKREAFERSERAHSEWEENKKQRDLAAVALQRNGSATLGLLENNGPACKGEDPDLFYAPDHETNEERKIRERIAKSICRRCVIGTTCLEENLYERDGIWGGTTPNERKQIIDIRKHIGESVR